MEASKTSAAVSHWLPFTIYLLDVCKTAFQTIDGGCGACRWTGSGCITYAWIAKQHKTREHKGSVLAFVCQCCRCCCSHRSCLSIRLGFFLFPLMSLISAVHLSAVIMSFSPFIPLWGSSLRTAAHVAWWGGSLRVVALFLYLSNLCLSEACATLLSNYIVLHLSPLWCHTIQNQWFSTPS